MAEIGDIAGLANIIQAIGGSSSKETQQTKVSPEAITRLVNDILSGESGVGRIGSATRKSGLYNSSTQELLLNDLISRASARGALASAPTERRTDVKGAGLVPMIATLAGTSALNTALNKGIGAIFGGDSSGALSKGISSIFGGSGSGAAPIVESVGLPGLNAGTAGASLAGGATSGLTSTLQANAIPGIGGLLSGILQGEDALKPENLLFTAGIPALFGGIPAAGTALLGTGIGAFGGDIFKGIGDIGKNIVEGIGDFFGGLF